MKECGWSVGGGGGVWVEEKGARVGGVCGDTSSFSGYNLQVAFASCSRFDTKVVFASCSIRLKNSWRAGAGPLPKELANSLI